MKVLIAVLFPLFIWNFAFAQARDCVCENDLFERSVAKSDLMVVGKVKNANFTLGTWASGTLSEKLVEYEVVTVIKGKAKVGESLFVLYPVVENYKWIATSTPKLSDKVFENGRRHFLVLLENQFPAKELERENRTLVGRNQWYIPIGPCIGMFEL